MNISLQGLMLQEEDPDLKQLEKACFATELGISKEQIAEAGKNFLGFFTTLYNIEQRLTKESQAKI